MGQIAHPSSDWRRELARQIAPVYAENSKVAAVVLGGSSARGHADRYSDIEIGVFWHAPPSDTERSSAVEQVNGDLLALYPFDATEQVWCDDFYMGRAAPDQPRSGVLIEMVHYTTEFMGTVLADVLERYDPSDLKQNLIAGVLTGLPLSGAPMVEQWQAAARHYPEGLRVAVLRRHAAIDHFWRYEMFLQRNNLMLLYGMYSQVEQQLLRVLLGLNRIYYFGFKWLEVVAAGLPIAPSNLVPRLNEVFCGDRAAAGRELAGLVEETYDLVEQHVPAVDIEWLRRVFRYKRPQWELPPTSLLD